MTTKNPLTGTGVSRRDMLRLGAGGIGLGLFGGIGQVPPVLSQASYSVAANQSGKILVVFEWFGGNDGLNTIIPYGDPLYYKHRPTIGIKERDVLKIDAQFGWYKSMRGMKRLYDNGKVDIVLAHGGTEQRQRVRLGRPHGCGPRSLRRSRKHDREHRREPNACGQGAEARTAGVRGSADVQARHICPGETGTRYARRRRPRT